MRFLHWIRPQIIWIQTQQVNILIHIMLCNIFQCFTLKIMFDGDIVQQDVSGVNSQHYNSLLGPMECQECIPEHYDLSRLHRPITCQHRAPATAGPPKPVVLICQSSDGMLGCWMLGCWDAGMLMQLLPDSKVHGANMGPIWGCRAHLSRFMGSKWGPSGADRTQVGPMLAPWIFLSG